MADLPSNTKTLNHYFSFLKHLDNHSKKKLISKLKSSLKREEVKSIHSDSVFGAWEDHRSTDEILKEIKDARVEKSSLNNF